LRLMCEYKDHEGIQVWTKVAEWRVAFGKGHAERALTAGLIHVPPALSDCSEHRVFPI